ncbi:MAG: carbohydrate ABC transporter permease [Chloroflexi bacterium]|nr:carbohydrate ABC transporter permease [Chloroflexota bacterium]
MSQKSVPFYRRRQFVDAGGKLAVYALLIVGALLSFFPFAWMVSTAFKTPEQVFALPIHWLPDPVTWGNFAAAWRRFDFARFFLNTLFISSMTTVLSVTICSMAGYAFARRRFWGRELIFNVLLATLTIPGAVLRTPLFLVILKLGWINRFIGIIVPFCVSVTNIFLMRQYISTIPVELEEAARIDGASDFAIWRRIILPLSQPAMATVAIFSFVGAWDGFLWPLIVLKDKEMWTLNVALGLLQTEYIAAEGSPWGVMMAGSVLVVLPLIGVFLTLQRYFMSGLMLGAVKG